MGKGNGSTRASASGNPRGLSGGSNGAQQLGPQDRLSQQEEIAERWYRNGELTVDPGDATYEAARYLRSDQFESIDNLTDYLAMPEVARDGRTVLSVTIMPKNYESRELVDEYGADSFRINLENQSLMEIITELRSSSMGRLFGKYR
jgi:hypothetical protein